MKEIKFRAWDKKKNTWLNMDKYAINPDGGLGLLYCGDQDFIIEDNVEAEIMQYTGLKDKNGIEIYEGDIIKINNTGFYETLVVEWDYIVLSALMNLYSRDAKEIIGNIYENKELLINKDK